MAYSHSRLRKTLSLVRVATGVVFVSVGYFKISSLAFARTVFPAFLENAIRGAAVEWMRPVLEWIAYTGPGRIGVVIGFVELFIGTALVLGLAVRPASLIGMIYSLALLLTTWNESGTSPSMLQSAEHQFRNLFPFLIFLLLGVGHAGETWGVGAMYHRHRDRAWIKSHPEGEAQPPESGAAAMEHEELEPPHEARERHFDEVEPEEWTATHRDREP